MFSIGLPYEKSLGKIKTDIKAPDLDVTYISRKPKYKNYSIFYPSGIPTIKPGTENDKRWPDPGETVTFTAHIKNKGDNASDLFDFQWFIDGNLVSDGSLPGLLSGEEVRTSIQWQWEGWNHTVEFIADPENYIDEFCETNNHILDRTDALYFWIRFKSHKYQLFNSCQNMKGSYSAEDWIQANVDSLNQCFQNAVYPLTPEGALERVRIDTIIVYEEGTIPFPDSMRNYIDGEWLLDLEPDSAYLSRTDWGFLHELCHQLGRIDIYVIGIGASDNRIMDMTGERIQLGADPNPVEHSLMFDVFPYLSEHTAYSLNRDLHKRRGYYGEYLLDVPKDNVLQVLDQNGDPVYGAQVRIYRKSGTTWEIPDEISIQGLTDDKGLFSLGSKPFGEWINIVGTNGLIFITISYGNYEHHQYLNILETNLAYWRGDSLRAEYTINTQFPGTGNPPPPTNLHAAKLQGSTATIEWDSPKDNVLFYNIYSCPKMLRDLSPKYPYQKTDTTSSEFYEFDIRDQAFYIRITAVYPDSQESAFSNEIFIIAYIGLKGISVSPKGERYILLNHFGDIIRQDIKGENGKPFFADPANKECWRFTIDIQDNIYYFNNQNWPNEDNPYGLRKHAPDGTQIFVFGKKGTGPGEFNNPYDVLLDSSNNIIILDTGNNRLQAFTQDSIFIALFGNYGSQDGEFDNPMGFCFDKKNNHIVVADTDNDRIQIIDFDGTNFYHINTFTGDNLLKPKDIAVDSKGRIITAENSRILIFDQAGNHIETYTGSNDDYAVTFMDITGIATDPEDNILINDDGHRVVTTILTGNQPSYPNSLPVISMMNESGFDCGVFPGTGNISTQFQFRVSYNDIDNDPPADAYPKIDLDLNGDGDIEDIFGELSEGNFIMTETDTNDTDYSNGKIYGYTTNLPAGLNINYKFIAYDINNGKAIAPGLPKFILYFRK
jgi:hypothetical protein